MSPQDDPATNPPSRSAATATPSRPEEADSTPRRQTGCRRGRRTPDGCGKDGDLHNRRTPERTEGTVPWELMILTSNPRWNTQTLNSLPFVRGGQERAGPPQMSPPYEGSAVRVFQGADDTMLCSRFCLLKSPVGQRMIAKHTRFYLLVPTAAQLGAFHQRWLQVSCRFSRR